MRHGAKGLLAVGALVAAGVVPGQEGEGPRVVTRHVAGHVHLLEGRGGNIGVSSGPDGAFLIDDQFRPLAEPIRAAVAAIGPGPIRFVLNTHYHRDHTDGNEPFGKAGVLVIAQDNVRRRLSAEDWIASLEKPELGLPVVTFDVSVTFHLNGDEIHAFHVARAHTDGDTVVHFRRANVVHMGDVYFGGFYPFIDVDGGGSVDGTIAAVERVLERTDASTRFIPGHGPVGGRDELVFYRDLLRDVRGRVAALIGEGKSLEEVQAARPSAAYDPEWGNDFIKPERFVEFIYRSLTE